MKAVPSISEPGEENLPGGSRVASAATDPNRKQGMKEFRRSPAPY